MIELSSFDGGERESEHRARGLSGIRLREEKYSGKSGNPKCLPPRSRRRHCVDGKRASVNSLPHNFT